jgi:hypothetical protein
MRGIAWACPSAPPRAWSACTVDTSRTSHCLRATPCCHAHIHPGAATLVPVPYGAPPHRHLRALPVDELDPNTDCPRITLFLLLQRHIAVAHQQSGLLDRSPARRSPVSSAQGQRSLPLRMRAPKERTILSAVSHCAHTCLPTTAPARCRLAPYMR